MKIKLILSVILTLTLFTGCSLGAEVGERAFVQLMGIERDDEIYSVSLQIYKSESGSAEADLSKANSVSVSGKGATVQSALENAELSVGKKLFLGHIKLLIIGNGVKNPADELSLFMDGSVSPACPVAYSDNPSAVAETLLEDGSYSAEQILALMDSSASHGKAVYTSVAELSADTGVLNCASPLPIISAENKTVTFDGVALTESGGIQGRLSADDVTGVKLLLNQFEQGDRITVPVIVDGRSVAVFITGSDTKLKVRITDGEPEVSAEIKLKTTIAENPYNISTPLIEKAVRESVADMCVNAYRTAVHYCSCDIFSIKKLVRKYCPDQYDAYCKNEEKYLSESRFTVSVK